MPSDFYFVDCWSSMGMSSYTWAYLPTSSLRLIECPKNSAHNRYENTRPISVAWTLSRSLADFTPADSAILDTERVRDSFVKAGFRGFRYYPVICVEYEPALRPDRSHEISDQAFAPEELQGKIWELWADLELKFDPAFGGQVKAVCDACGLRELTRPTGAPLCFDFSNWNGEDAVDLLGEAIYVSERVVRFAKKEGFTGVEFVPAKSIGQPLPGTNVVEEFLPGLREGIRKMLAEPIPPNQT